MNTQHEITLDEHCNWFAKASCDTKRRLLIVEGELGPLGYVQLNNVTPGGVADWGFYAKPNSPKGSGRKLGQMALKHAFGELKLYKVCGHVIESNAASIAFHKKLGFTLEGVLRDQQCITGTCHSIVCFGLSEHEFRSKLDFLESTSEAN
jgi:RimJ/RimL family protein N-acetyltransferase